jgi:hypothetical protein
VEGFEGFLGLEHCVLGWGGCSRWLQGVGECGVESGAWELSEVLVVGKGPENG